MNPIIVSEKNRERIATAIEEAEGRATVRCLTYAAVLVAIERIEAKLDLPKARMEGVSFHVDTWAQDFPNAYEYTPMSTQFNLTLSKGKWRISDIGRAPVQRAGRKCQCIEMPEALKYALIMKYEAY